jgi:Gnt-I system low-affinity gluconate transporter
MDTGLIIAVLSGISILLILILVLRIPAFISLLIASIFSGLLAGMNGKEVIDTIQEGMGSTLGFVATVVGLGAMFGAILERSGGAKAIARYMLKKMGVEKAPLSMVITGFIVAIPVFFDVAFIILAPILFALQKRTGKSLLLYAIPLLSGLAITHAFIPPTPGPVAVADIIGADLGWVILMGILAGIPTAWISGLFYGKYISGKIFVPLPEIAQEEETETTTLPSAMSIIMIIGIPILLILLSTFVKSGIIP